ncbi:MAG TPA: DedA family protein [Acidimicrobiales bacterium]|nr:DedA family protein [Acidimicrobiales bacterium]
MPVATILSFILHEIHRLPGSVVYGMVALLVFGEAALFIGFILPGETAVLVAGVVASQGRVNIGALCALVVVAAIVGDSVGYAVGHRYGERLLRIPVMAKRSAEIGRALEGLRRRGPTYVFVGRFTAFLRAVMPGLAGMSKMHYPRFLWANALGGLIWGVSFSLLGYFAGNALNKIEKWAGWGSLGLLLLVIGLWVAFFLRRRARARRDSGPEGT